MLYEVSVWLAEGLLFVALSGFAMCAVMVLFGRGR
jgi:hypothetical protein